MPPDKKIDLGPDCIEQHFTVTVFSLTVSLEGLCLFFLNFCEVIHYIYIICQ